MAGKGNVGFGVRDDTSRLRLFRDLGLGVVGNDGHLSAVWHWRSRSFSWIVFSDIPKNVNDKAYGVVAVVLTVASMFPGSLGAVGLVRAASGVSSVRLVDVLGPVWFWLLPFLPAFVGWVLAELWSVRRYNRWQEPADPSLEERTKYVESLLEVGYRHPTGEGHFPRLKIPYLGLIILSLVMAGCTALMEWVLWDTDNILVMVVFLLGLVLVEWGVLVLVLLVLPRLLLLLCLERRCKAELAARGESLDSVRPRKAVRRGKRPVVSRPCGAGSARDAGRQSGHGERSSGAVKPNDEKK